MGHVHYGTAGHFDSVFEIDTVSNYVQVLGMYDCTVTGITALNFTWFKGRTVDLIILQLHSSNQAVPKGQGQPVLPMPPQRQIKILLPADSSHRSSQNAYAEHTAKYGHAADTVSAAESASQSESMAPR